MSPWRLPPCSCNPACNVYNLVGPPNYVVVLSPCVYPALLEGRPLVALRSATSRRPSRLVLPKPYHLVRDRKGRRVILCAIGNCVQAFSEIPSFNDHISTCHGRDMVHENEIKQVWQNATATSRRRLRRELGPQDSVGNCVDFIRLRGTLAARWRISKRRKFKRLMDRALEFAEKRTAITGNSTYAQLEFQVRIAYRMWKQHEKERTLATLSANLKDTLVTKYHLTEEHAVLQGGLDEEILDSSDDES
ncbi:hypothetical protein R1sor_007800 [Riccia sorocarpa]|uniref:C2H2-type domain-containing protein n=1 Tax=Riccia sorocarpa TaxID=122646 RepID=A0ABD3HTY0_9MARC